jgi:integrase
MARKKSVGRRGNNEGTVCQRSDGRWTAAVIVGVDGNGKPVRKFVYGKTRPEVLVKLSELTEARGKMSGIITNEDMQTLMQEWLLTFKQSEVAARTFEKNLSFAKWYVYPAIGEMKVNEVSTENVQKLLNGMRIDGYALDTVKHTKHLMRQFFEYCKDSGFVSENPVDKVKLQSRERKIATKVEYKAIPPEARQKFLEVIEKSKFFKALCMTMMFGGLRIGEALALRWRDVDLNKKRIRIDNAVTLNVKFDDSGKVTTRDTEISDTKTAASVRTATMPEVLVKTLEQWRTERWRMRNVSESKGKPISFIEPDDLVFSTDDGNLRTYYGTRTMFDRLMKANDLGKYNIHFHTLRHTYSTMLFEAGENPKVVQELMGHKDLSTTMRYNSVDDNSFVGAADKLDAKFNKIGGAEMD